MSAAEPSEGDIQQMEKEESVDNDDHRRRERRIAYDATMNETTAPKDNSLSIDGQQRDGLMIVVDQLAADNVVNLTSTNHKGESVKGIIFGGIVTNPKQENVLTANSMDSVNSIRTLLVLTMFGVCALIYIGKSYW